MDEFAFELFGSTYHIVPCDCGECTVNIDHNGQIYCCACDTDLKIQDRDCVHRCCYSPVDMGHSQGCPHNPENDAPSKYLCRICLNNPADPHRGTCDVCHLSKLY